MIACKHFKALALGIVLVTLYFRVALFQCAVNYGKFKVWYTITQILTLRKMPSSNNVKTSSYICTLTQALTPRCYTLASKLCTRYTFIKENKSKALLGFYTRWREADGEWKGDKREGRNVVGGEKDTESSCVLHMFCLIAVINESLMMTLLRRAIINLISSISAKEKTAYVRQFRRQKMSLICIHFKM